MGLHLVACGDSAVTSLVPLLDVKLVAGIYRGSKESKLGNGDRARVCDFAAFLPLQDQTSSLFFSPWPHRAAQREIEQLKTRLLAA